MRLISGLRRLKHTWQFWAQQIAGIAAKVASAYAFSNFFGFPTDASLHYEEIKAGGEAADAWEPVLNDAVNHGTKGTPLTTEGGTELKAAKCKYDLGCIFGSKFHASNKKARHKNMCANYRFESE